MPIVWPKNPKLDDVVSAANALDARLTTIEQRVVRNEAAIAFILSLVHPEPLNTKVTTAAPSAGAWHAALMDWMNRYGGRVHPPEPKVT